jgi:multiple sugar transport system permease protein
MRGLTEKLGRIPVYLLLALGALITMGPFIIMVSTSLKPQAYVLETPPQIFPEDATFGNYEAAWTTSGFARYFLNSTYVTILSVFGILLLSSMMAYALSRFEFAGKRIVYWGLLLTLMIPGMMLIVPQFILAQDIGVINSHLGLILFYIAGQLAFSTFLLQSFFSQIPRELEEAMRMDGAGAWTVYWRLILPMSKPALATAGIFVFLSSWDEFIWALTIISDASLRTLPMAIALFQGQHATAWGLVFAASVIAVGPVIVVFVAFQRYFVAGIAEGAVKG